jgi:hypothetical protein
MTMPNFQALVADLSAARLRAMADGPRMRSEPAHLIAWHLFNAAIGKALYPTLQILELGNWLAKDVFRLAPRTDRNTRTIDQRLTNVRNLRNRVFHHERLVHRSQQGSRSPHAAPFSQIPLAPLHFRAILPSASRVPRDLNSAGGNRAWRSQCHGAEVSPERAMRRRGS